MNIQQLRFVRETVRQNCNVSAAAAAMGTSQPGVSKAIIELEKELGFELFERFGRRLTRLTAAGVHVHASIERIVQEYDNLQRISADLLKGDEGALTVACTHTQARYALPRVIPTFRKRFPNVRLSLVQGSPPQLADLVLREKADIALATESIANTPGIVALPCYDWEHMIVVPQGHPLEHAQLSLKALSQFPIVTYDSAFTGRHSIDEAFAKAGVRADVVLEAIDADVIKTYVELGLGVGIVAGMAYDKTRDKKLSAIPAGKLFGKHTTRIGVKQGAFLRGFVYDLIELLSPQMNRAAVDQAIAK